MDQHHGDGVQDAFEFTNKVMTCSFHKYMPGFFPGTGDLEENGKGNMGMYHTINVPFVSGIDDQMYYDTFMKIFNKIQSQYRPEVIVMQCGADSLYNDPIDLNSPFNLTINGYCKCVQLVIDKNIPTIFLGGGGYNFANTSRLWTSITNLIVNNGNNNNQLNNDIPEHEYFLEYKPDYELNISPGLIKNKNIQSDVNTMVNKIIENLNNIKFD
jgi:histone deacetylase 8